MEKFASKYKLNEEQLNQLKQIVPEAFRDNILDFNNLYEALSDFVENDEDTDIEQFGLTWPGKRKAKRAAAIPPVGTLVPVPGDGVDEDTTRNIYIEGDNLEVLKIIKKAYTGRIKMIYIDPPYNTGNDFIYPDDFSEVEESYKRRTGQIDENGVKMTTNNRSDGRFHSKWCSMTYPRLRLARELLSEDGVIFISIDDNEIDNMKKICNEIFGEENFRNTILTRRYDKNINRQFMEEGLSTMNTGVEYILFYSNIPSTKYNPVYREASEERATYGYWKGFWNDANRPTMRYDILGVTPETGQWKWKKEVADEAITNYQEYYTKYREKMTLEDYWSNTGKSKKFIRRNPSSRGKNQGVEHWIPPSDNILRNTNWSDLLASKPTGTDVPFDNPKNIDVIIELIKISNVDENGIILDFFSGSATTAHAVMKLNAEDGGKRQFIMVQILEACKEDSEAAKAGFKNICKIGKERIRRAGKKIKEEAGLNTDNIDTGFKVFRLAPSNYKAWENYNGTDAKQLEELFKQDSLKPDWKEDNLITEEMLLTGFPLDSNIELLPQFKKNKVKKISSDFHENTLYICLDKDIHNETIETLSLTDKERFICLDSAIDDQSKIRLEDKNLIKTL
jgi:adenine-specific DNA-methyltransferase